MWVAPGWCLHDGHVLLAGARSERKLLEQLQKGTSRYTLVIRFDGLLAHPVFRWLLPTDLPDPERALSANLEVVRTAHEALLRAFSRVDVSSFEGKPGDGEVSGTTDLARVNAILAEEEGTEEEDVGERRGASLRLSPRLGVFLSRLERHFGVEVRSARGSELALYREGGRIYTMGRHKRNPRVRWPYVRRVLRALNIAEEEWSDVVAGRA